MSKNQNTNYNLFNRWVEQVVEEGSKADDLELYLFKVNLSHPIRGVTKTILTTLINARKKKLQETLK